MTEVVPSPCNLPLKENPMSPRDGSFFGTQRTLRSRAKPTVTKAKKFLKGVQKIVKTRSTPRSADSDVHLGFDETLEP